MSYEREGRWRKHFVDSLSRPRRNTLDDRKKALVEGRPYAKPIKFPLEWCMGAPAPVLLSSEIKTFLIFFLAGGDSRVGMVEFHEVWSAQFGEPDENAIMSHSMIDSGLEFGCVSEVVGSPWVAEIAERWVSGHPNFEPSKLDVRHLIFPFHDSTFECVAKSFTATEVDVSYRAAVAQAAEML